MKFPNGSECGAVASLGMTSHTVAALGLRTAVMAAIRGFAFHFPTRWLIRHQTGHVLGRHAMLQPWLTILKTT